MFSTAPPEAFSTRPSVAVSETMPLSLEICVSAMSSRVLMVRSPTAATVPLLVMPRPPAATTRSALPTATLPSSVRSPLLSSSEKAPAPVLTAPSVRPLAPG